MYRAGSANLIPLFDIVKESDTGAPGSRSYHINQVYSTWLADNYRVDADKRRLDLVGAYALMLSKFNNNAKPVNSGGPGAGTKYGATGL